MVIGYHSAWFCLVSAALAGGVTLFDLDKTFVAGGQGARHAYHSAWWWTFIIANAVLASAVFFALRGISAFGSWGSWQFAVFVGLGYLALVRLKFATVMLNGQEIPVGLDAFYQSGRDLVFRRINEEITAERIKVARQLVETRDLKDLGNQVRLKIDLDVLLPLEEKKTRKAWLLKVLQDKGPDDQKKFTLAIYLASGTPS
jgi:hypothetical protein